MVSFPLRPRSLWLALLVAALLVAALALIVLAQRGPRRPGTPFDHAGAPPAPDYASVTAWAARPDRDDAADVAPPGAVDAQATAAVDVFFVHPTTYLVGDRWNATVGLDRVDQRTDATSIRNQASVFNGAGRVWAPRYRQAILYAYIHDDAESLAARTLAYEDVARAFDTYLERYSAGRPFILAGHSQGSHHVLRLMEEKLRDPALRQRLVVAYLVGVPMPADKLYRTLDGIPLCATPAQTGCLVSWNTVATWADRERFAGIWHYYPAPVAGQATQDGTWESNAGKDLVCANPLSWRDHRQMARPSGPRRAVAPSRRGPLLRARGPDEARCVDGLLEISDPRGPSFRLTRGRKGDYHRYDLPLFHFDVRDNARLRAERYLATAETAQPSHH